MATRVALTGRLLCRMDCSRVPEPMRTLER